MLAEYQDIESGKVDDRPQLQRALSHASLAGARIIIAKLDRLSRDVAFIAQMQKAAVCSFIAADMPEAGELQTHMMAAFAQHERKAISQRTKAALASAKARGVKLGNPANLSNQLQGSVAGNAVKTAKADAHAREVAGWLDDARAAGAVTLRAIADYFNRQRFEAPRGGKWSPVQVSRVLKRIA